MRDGDQAPISWLFLISDEAWSITGGLCVMNGAGRPTRADLSALSCSLGGSNEWQGAAEADVAHVPLFLPHLDGERAPLWDPDARGAFTGLTSATGAPELALAVLEGVAYSARLVFDSLAQSAGREAEIIHHAGGGASSDLWCQIRADVLGKPLRRSAMRDAGVLGAALMAGVGVGVFGSMKEAVRNFVPFEAMFAPCAETAGRHAARFAAYGVAYEQLRAVRE